jgi:hypothetical protein
MAIGALPNGDPVGKFVSLNDAAWTAQPWRLMPLPVHLAASEPIQNQGNGGKQNDGEENPIKHLRRIAGHGHNENLSEVQPA